MGSQYTPPPNTGTGTTSTSTQSTDPPPAPAPNTTAAPVWTRTDWCGRYVVDGGGPNDTTGA